MFPLQETSIDRETLLLFRDALLKQVDAVERMLHLSPRTSEIRKMYRDEQTGEDSRRNNPE